MYTHLNDVDFYIICFALLTMARGVKCEMFVVVCVFAAHSYNINNVIILFK